MSDRFHDFEEFLHDKTKQLLNRHMESVREANEVNADPNSTSSEASQVERETQGHSTNFHHETSEEAQKEAEQVVEERGGQPFPERQVQQQIKTVVEDINKAGASLHWAAANIKVLGGILAAAAVAIVAGVSVFHFRGFEHPLVSTSPLMKVEIANAQWQMEVEMSEEMRTINEISNLARSNYVPAPTGLSIPLEVQNLEIRADFPGLPPVVRPLNQMVSAVPSSYRREFVENVSKSGSSGNFAEHRIELKSFHAGSSFGSFSWSK